MADAVTLRTLREVPMTEVLSLTAVTAVTTMGISGPNMLIGPDGALYFTTYHAGLGTLDIIRVDQNTLKETNSFPTAGGIFSFTDTGFTFPDTCAIISDLRRREAA